MPILLSSIFAIVAGFSVIGFTSPTASCLESNPTSIINLHVAVVDTVLAMLVCFLILCRLEPVWIAKNQSFPYSYHISWNLGAQSFNFQLLIFYIFHIRWFSWLSHVIFLPLEEMLWMIVIHLTFGNVGFCLAIAGLSLQAYSFGDILLTVAICLTNATFAGIGYAVTELLAYDNNLVLNLSKIMLFWLVTVRTVAHAFEPLPPTYSPETKAFDSGFGDVAWQLCFRNFPKSVWLFLLGTVSEFGAGVPGRFFNSVVYIGMYTIGFRSGCVLDVIEVKKQAVSILEHGWQAHPTTADMYRWAAPQQEQVEDVKMPRDLISEL